MTQPLFYPSRRLGISSLLGAYHHRRCISSRISVYFCGLMICKTSFWWYTMLRIDDIHGFAVIEYEGSNPVSKTCWQNRCQTLKTPYGWDLNLKIDFSVEILRFLSRRVFLFVCFKKQLQTIFIKQHDSVYDEIKIYFRLTPSYSFL